MAVAGVGPELSPGIGRVLRKLLSGGSLSIELIVRVQYHVMFTQTSLAAHLNFSAESLKYSMVSPAHKYRELLTLLVAGSRLGRFSILRQSRCSQ